MVVCVWIICGLVKRIWYPFRRQIWRDATISVPCVPTLVCQSWPHSYGARSDERRPPYDSTGCTHHVTRRLVPEQRGRLQETAAENQTWHQLISTGWKTKTYNNGEFIERFQRFNALHVRITSTSLSRSGYQKCAWCQHFVLLLKIGSLTKNNVHVH